ncbi:MAG TPA: superoxide dismutase family protein [Methylomirabilota bacterium]|nr:superoxide dismutase family protein [Methylomirabilota bacterium]
MKRIHSITLCLLAAPRSFALVAVGLGLAAPLTVRAADPGHADKVHASTWAAVKQAVAIIHPTAGNKCQGKITFTQEGENVKVVAEIEGLNPGQKHAFHIHQFGDCSAPDAMSAGGHYNPENHEHGLPEKEHRHAGDLGNLQADAAGKARYEIVVKNISIAGVKNPIIGRGVIIHAKPDDGGQPVGNAGARIACGVIGVANPGK